MHVLKLTLNIKKKYNDYNNSNFSLKNLKFVIFLSSK